MSDPERRVVMRKKVKEIQRGRKVKLIAIEPILLFRISYVVNQEPDLVLLAASLNEKVEIELFKKTIKGLRKQLPDAKIAIQTPILSDRAREEMRELGVDGFIDEKLAYEYLGLALQDVAKKD